MTKLKLAVHERRHHVGEDGCEEHAKVGVGVWDGMRHCYRGAGDVDPYGNSETVVVNV